MEILLRFLALILSYLGLIINYIFDFLQPRKAPDYPSIRNPLLLKSVIELVTELRRGEVIEY